MRNIFLIVCFAMLASCTDYKKQSHYKFERIEDSDIVFDLVFPKSFWQQMIRDSPPTIKSDTSVYELLEALPTDVKLIEEKGKVLRGVNSLVVFQHFGGKIDYSQYLGADVNGSFRLEFDLALEEEQTLKVFFLSWSQQVTNGDETIGNGCNVLYDVTSYFTKDVLKNGLLLHTSQGRYLNLTAGRFYFISYQKHKIALSQITFTDSRFESQLCKNKI